MYVIWIVRNNVVTMNIFFRFVMIRYDQSTNLLEQGKYIYLPPVQIRRWKSFKLLFTYFSSSHNFRHSAISNINIIIPFVNFNLCPSQTIFAVARVLLCLPEIRIRLPFLTFDGVTWHAFVGYFYQRSVPSPFIQTTSKRASPTITRKLFISTHK